MTQNAAKKYIVLPEWMTALKDRMNFLEDEMKRLSEIIARIQSMEEDVKSLKQLVHERQLSDSTRSEGPLSHSAPQIAQGLPAPNVPIINQSNLLAGRRIKPGSHPRKSIHDDTISSASRNPLPTFSIESKITKIEKSDPNII